jgi:uncharacterized protein
MRVDATAGATPAAGDGRRRGPVRAVVACAPLASFFVLATALSWAYWMPLALSGGTGSHMPGLLGPAIAGVIVTWCTDGRAGVFRLLARSGRWRVDLRWYAVAVSPLLIAVTAVGAAALAGRGSDAWVGMAHLPGLPDLGWVGVFALVLVINGVGEEVGWRGVAWPQLRVRHGLAAAALRLAAPWALWHLPTFWITTGLQGMSPWMVAGWLVALPFGAVFLGWLYERTDASLLIVVLFHACLNMASATRATEGVPAALTSVAVIGAAVLILRRDAAEPTTSTSFPVTSPSSSSSPQDWPGRCGR